VILQLALSIGAAERKPDDNPPQDCNAKTTKTNKYFNKLDTNIYSKIGWFKKVLTRYFDKKNLKIEL
jgi:hypothetical protein